MGVATMAEIQISLYFLYTHTILATEQWLAHAPYLVHFVANRKPFCIRMKLKALAD